MIGMVRSKRCTAAMRRAGVGRAFLAAALLYSLHNEFVGAYPLPPTRVTVSTSQEAHVGARTHTHKAAALRPPPCTPRLRLLSPAYGAVLPISRSEMAELEIRYVVDFDCPEPVRSFGRAHTHTHTRTHTSHDDALLTASYMSALPDAIPPSVPSLALAGYTVELLEHQHWDAGYVRVCVGVSVHVALSEPGAYAFDMRLCAPRGAGMRGNATESDVDRNMRVRAAASDPRTHTGRAHTHTHVLAGLPPAEASKLDCDTVSLVPIIFTVVHEGVTHVPPCILRRFEAGLARYAHTFTHTHAHAQECDATSSGMDGRLAAGDRMATPAELESFPDKVARIIDAHGLRPVTVAVVGSVGPYFDGTKGFLVQHESVCMHPCAGRCHEVCSAVRRLISYSHVDMSVGEDEGSRTLMARMLRNASVPVHFAMLQLEEGAFSSPTDFFESSARISRVQSWCELSPRLQRAFRRLAGIVLGHDVFWHVNHSHLEDYFPHLARLLNPSIVRVLDVVGRVSVACRYNRRPPFLGTPQRATRSDDIMSACPDFANDSTYWPHVDLVVPSWHVASQEGAYTHRQYVDDLRSFGAGLNRRERRASLDRPFDAAQERIITDVEYNQGARRRWQPHPHELVIAPSHFVAQHLSVRTLRSETVVVSGLHRPIPDDSTIKHTEFDCDRALGAPSLVAAGRLRRVAFIGRLSREKGLPLFLAGIAELLRQPARICTPSQTGLGNCSTYAAFYVVGSAASYYGIRMRELAEHLGITQNVQFSGFVEPRDLTALYSHQCIDVVVTPYLRPLSETFGLVVTEAMSAAVPVVALNVGGMNDYVRDGDTAFVVPYHTPEALATVLGRVLQDDILRKQVGARAQAFVSDRIRQEALAHFTLTTFRREVAAQQLVYSHVSPPSRDVLQKLHQECAPEDMRPVHALQDFVQGILEHSNAAGAGTCTAWKAHQQAAYKKLAVKAHMHRLTAGTFMLNVTIELDIQPKLLDIVGVQDEDGWLLARAVLPGLGDAVCGFETSCSVADAAGSIAALAYKNLHQHGQLCLVQPTSAPNPIIDDATTCFHLMDLPDVMYATLPEVNTAASIVKSGRISVMPLQMKVTSHASGVAADGQTLVIPRTEPTQQSALGVAITDNRVPYLLLAASVCQS